MTCRRLLFCTAVVLMAHGALACMVSLTCRPVTRAPATGARTAVRLVTLRPPQEPARTETVRRQAEPVAVHRSTAAPEPLVAQAVPGFKSPAELDRVALPRSAPDTTVLEGLPWSGVPMRLRLFVSADGTVVDVAVLASSDAAEVVARVRGMFMAMAFIPGRANGIDTPSYKDLELTVGSQG